MATAFALADIDPDEEQAEAAGAVDAFVPITTEIIENPDPEDWIMWRRTQNSWGYSPLDQINQDNVAGLQLAWVTSMEAGTNETTPLVYDGIMYLVNPGDVIYALDATTGDKIWEYRHALPEGVSTTSTSRNIAMYDTMIYHSTADAKLIAIDARSGQLVWEAVIGDYNTSLSASSGPIIVKDMVVSPHVCSRRGTVVDGGCFITAHDAFTGEEIWRRHTIAQEGEHGDDTWNGTPVENRFHSSPWVAGSYDPELDILYWGTAATAPHSRLLRPEGDGDLLYTNSTLALDPDTGEIIWYFQHVPNDNWDLDTVFERILVDTVVAPDPSEVDWISPNIEPGAEYRVITGAPGKTGQIYTLDRETGEFLWARDTVYQNIIEELDLVTGRPTYNEEVIHTELDQTLFVCPQVAGGRNWPAGAYSPRTGNMYLPLNNTCSELTPYADERFPGGGQYRWPAVASPDGDGNVGRVEAVNASTGATAWKFQTRPATNTGLVATAGGLLFSGDLNRRFRALDDETGEVLWETILGGAVGGFAVSYAVDGTQYVAISAGGGGQVQGDFAPLTPELNTAARGNNMLYVFALPDAQ